MTTVYEPHVEAGYEWVMPVGSTEPIRQVPARRRGDPWSPLWMDMLTIDPEEGGRPRLTADMPWHGSHVLVVKRRAREVLEPVLAQDAEFLPLDYNEEETDGLWLVNAWRVVDALDEDRSVLRRFSDGSGRIMAVHRYVFWEEPIRGLRCFRVPQRLTMFVADEVAAAAREAGLRGTTFRPVWHSAEMRGY